MTTASHYVIDDILGAKKTGEFASVFKKFAGRYSNDIEFIEIYKAFEDDKDTAKAIGKLEELASARRLEESDGGGNLPYKDRRHLDGGF